MLSLKNLLFSSLQRGGRLGLCKSTSFTCLEDSLGNSILRLSTSSKCQKEENKENIDKLVEYGIKEEKSSKAMQAYLNRSQAYNAFMEKEELEYKTGKRHLANMMGKDPESFTQDDVNAAIEYLFPSGLFVKKARPIMKPPKEVHPPKKEAEFDYSGRPYHYLFYTGKPNFYSFLHKLVDTIIELNKFEDTMIRKQLKPDPALLLTLEGYQWLSKSQFETKLIESLSDDEYNQLIATLERVSTHPYSYRVKDMIMECRASVVKQVDEAVIPKPELQADGREFVTYECSRRKTAQARITVRSPGTGIININGRDLSYFPDLHHREQLLFPLHVTNKIDAVDIEATVKGSGLSSQAGAIRYGIAMCLRSFVNTDMIEAMRLMGLLTHDHRRRERKKPGQEKARRKFTWKKR